MVESESVEKHPTRKHIEAYMVYSMLGGLSSILASYNRTKLVAWGRRRAGHILHIKADVCSVYKLQGWHRA